MENMTQYQKDLVRMWDSLRENHKGTPTCFKVNCEVCPLNVCCHGDGGNISFNAEKSIEVVAQWAKEHPVFTRADKYKEVFGVEPKNDKGSYSCPRYTGFYKKETNNCALVDGCERCTREFWESEYKPPKADKEGVENEN